VIGEETGTGITDKSVGLTAERYVGNSKRDTIVRWIDIGASCRCTPAGFRADGVATASGLCGDVSGAIECHLHAVGEAEVFTVSDGPLIRVAGHARTWVSVGTKRVRGLVNLRQNAIGCFNLVRGKTTRDHYRGTFTKITVDVSTGRNDERQGWTFATRASG